MPELVWYRSLYWRIAIGFVVLVAALLITQAIVFLWLTGRMAELVPGRSPAELAQTIAADLEKTIPGTPGLNVDEYLNSRYTSLYRPFVVALRDGTVVSSRTIPPPPDAGRIALNRLMMTVRQPAPPSASPDGDRSGSGRSDRPGRGRGSDRFEGSGRGGRGSGPGRGPGPSGFEYAPVVAVDQTIGMVAVPIDPPPLWFAVRGLGPTLGIAAVVLPASWARRC
jgi:hypothetical protein